MGQQRSLFVDFRPEKAAIAVVTPAKPYPIIEEFAEVETLAQLKQLARKHNPKSRYTRVVVGAYPSSRFLRYAVLENPSKAREDGFFEEYLQVNCQVDLAKSSVAILNPTQGLPIDMDKVVPKELLFCGAHLKEWQEIQRDLVANTLFPDRLELGSVATLGGLHGYLRAQQISNPAVVLEWGERSINMMIPSARKVELVRTISFGTQQLLGAIQSELGLKDIDSVKRLLNSKGFDLNEMGGSFLKGFLKELQASMGFFEVQTGQTISNFLVTLLPENLLWVQDVLSRYIGVNLLKVDYEGWARIEGLRAAEGVSLKNLDNSLFGLFSLITNHTTRETQKNN